MIIDVEGLAKRYGRSDALIDLTMQVEPGETKTMRWVASKVGVNPFYCSNFCSALHQEMQGYLVVSNAGQPLPGAVYSQPVDATQPATQPAASPGN